MCVCSSPLLVSGETGPDRKHRGCRFLDTVDTETHDLPITLKFKTTLTQEPFCSLLFFANGEEAFSHGCEADWGAVGAHTGARGGDGTARWGQQQQLGSTAVAPLVLGSSADLRYAHRNSLRNL